jgi:Protein of unknown function (DUF3237)
MFFLLKNINMYLSWAILLCWCQVLVGQNPVPPEPRLELLFEARIALDTPQAFGKTTYGVRRIINITGGRFEGKELRGTVLPGGADWQTVRADGTADLEARYTLKTDDGALIYVQNRGIRTGSPEVLARLAKGEAVDPSEYYMRTSATFEVSGDRYAWLSKLVAVSAGVRLKNEVLLQFYKVL